MDEKPMPNIEPDENEDTDNVQPGHEFTLRCGCTPHRDADLILIPGCPVKFANDILVEKLELETEHLFLKAALLGAAGASLELNEQLADLVESFEEEK